MALIEFKNLPDTSTPLNAENLNNNFNELSKALEKNYITVTNNNEGTPTSVYGFDTVPFDEVLSSNGNKFTLSNNKVIIGSGVSRIKASAIGVGYFKNTGTTQLDYTFTIRKNNTNIIVPRKIIKASTELLTDIITIPTLIFDVEENDVIELAVYGSSGKITKQALRFCFLTIEDATY